MGKLVLDASLLALPMNPEEATKTQDNVGKASAIIWIHSASLVMYYLFKTFNKVRVSQGVGTFTPWLQIEFDKMNNMEGY